MVAANETRSTIDFPRRNERAKEQMAFGDKARRRCATRIASEIDVEHLR
jgi:hypothetical protein